MRLLGLGLLVVGCGFRPTEVTALAPDAAFDATLDAARDTSGPAERLVIEAEQFTTTTMPGANAWTARTDQAGFSGTAFMQCGPGTGAYCPNDAALGICAATLVYSLQIATAGTYYVHVRGLAFGTSDDSVWYGVDGPAAADSLDLIHDSQWHWTTGATTYTLAAGAHTLTIWQRECGARADVVAVTPSAIPPS
ncbi:MAG: hypothetical protein ABJE66_23465 [Deltaproteobacteria bacterium]